MVQDRVSDNDAVEYELDDEYDDTNSESPEDGDDSLEFPEDAYRTSEAEDDDAESIVVSDGETEEDGEQYIKFKPEAESQPNKVAEKARVEAKNKSNEKKKVGNPFAALRRSERENKILTDRLEKVLERLTIPVDAETQEPEPEMPDYSEDPMAHVNAKADKIIKKLDKDDAEKAREKEVEFLRGSLQAADRSLFDYREKITPDNYDAAMMHLVTIQRENLEESNPDKTSAEIDAYIADSVMREKISLIRQGKNPGEVFYNRAKRFGYRPDEAKSKTGDSNKEPRARTEKVAVNPKDELARKRAIDAKSVTITKASGKPAKGKLTVSDIATMNEDDFNRAIDGIARSKGRRGEVRMSDLMETISN